MSDHYAGGGATGDTDSVGARTGSESIAGGATVETDPGKIEAADVGFSDTGYGVRSIDSGLVEAETIGDAGLDDTLTAGIDSVGTDSRSGSKGRGGFPWFWLCGVLAVLGVVLYYFFKITEYLRKNKPQEELLSSVSKN
jgi:hypothetical protein